MSNKVKILKRVIELDLTADDWQLYTVSMNCNAAAAALNKAIIESVGEGLSRDETDYAVEKVMDKYSSFGAYDSEPRGVLRDTLDKIYGKEN